MTDSISPPQDSPPRPEFVIEKSRRHRPYFGLLYGSPGVGKTTLASSIPGSIVIDLERGADGMDCDRITIEDAQNPQATIAKIKRSIAFAVEHGYTTIIIDSLTSLAALFEKQFLIENQKTTLDTGNFGQDYQAINDMLKAFLGSQTARTGTLAYLSAKGCNLILIGHEKEKIDSVGDSKLLHSTVPNLFKGMVLWLAVQCDFIFYYTHDIVIKEETLGMTKEKLSATRGRKIITCQEGGILAKNRYSLKPVISNPKANLFTDIYNPLMNQYKTEANTKNNETHTKNNTETHTLGE